MRFLQNKFCTPLGVMKIWLIGLQILICQTATAQSFFQQGKVFELPGFLELEEAEITEPNIVGIDMDFLFGQVAHCIPQKSKFKLEINLVGRFNSSSTLLFDENQVGSTGRTYVGITAKILLFSSIKIERQINWEMGIREKAATRIGKLTDFVVKAKRAQKEVGMYATLEKRAQLRIHKGITTTDEQVNYLTKLVAAQSKLDGAMADIRVARMNLTAVCREVKRPVISNLIKRMTKDALK